MIRHPSVPSYDAKGFFTEGCFVIYHNKNDKSSLEKCGALSKSRISAANCFLRSWSWIIFSSIVSRVMNFKATTVFVCPIRCARAIACSSTEGFHHGSRIKTYSAAVKFKPIPPAFSEIKKV